MDIQTSLLTFGSIVLLDIVLSGDNAVVIGAKAATLPAHQRDKAILYGMTVAVVARVVLSLVATILVTIPGLRTAGGLSLLWVAYGMYKDLTDAGSELDGSSEVNPTNSFRQALLAITVADLSMSIDNVLAVAGAANGHWGSLVFGLVLSIAIMMLAAKLVASLIQRWRWLAWIGLVLVLYIAGKLIYEDWPTLVALFHSTVG